MKLRFNQKNFFIFFILLLWVITLIFSANILKRRDLIEGIIKDYENELKLLENCTNSSIESLLLEDRSIIVCANNISTLEGENHCFVFPSCNQMKIWNVDKEKNKVYWICKTYERFLKENKTQVIF